MFVYETRDEFFGALGPGAREWTGAAAYSELRTIFMWLGGGSTAYLEVAMLHEVTHIVFHDATDNPYHEPARWLNEGIATWSENGDAGGDRSIVEVEDGQMVHGTVVKIDKDEVLVAHELRHGSDHFRREAGGDGACGEHPLRPGAQVAALATDIAASPPGNPR